MAESTPMNFRLRIWDEKSQSYRLLDSLVGGTTDVVTTEHDGLIPQLPGDAGLVFNGLGIWDKMKGSGSLFMFEVDEDGNLYQLYFEDEELQEFQLDPDGSFWAIFDDEHRLYLGNLRDDILQGIDQGGTGADNRQDAVSNLLTSDVQIVDDPDNGYGTQWWYDNLGVVTITTVNNNEWLPVEILNAKNLSEQDPAIVLTLPYNLHNQKFLFQLLFNGTEGTFYRINTWVNVWTAWRRIGPEGIVSLERAGLAPQLPLV